MHRGEIGKLTGAVAAMYASNKPEVNPSLAAIAMLLAPAHEYEVWPENWPAIKLFLSLQTQWRTGGMGGYIGLDYNVLFARLDRLKLSDQDHEWMFDDIRTIESEALSIINNKDS